LKGIMFVGTSSGAGKSLFTTAFCKLLRDMGLKVCPFKAQNMSLQSYITKDGGEIGLAQALQAIAGGIEPRVEFNPILLKASGKQGSQVIVLGRVFKTMKPAEYYLNKKFFWKKVQEALETLKKEYDVIVAEGAGSPAEINLLNGDIVNLRIADYLKIPSVLVADIDRGGVFASIYGTKALLNRFYPEGASWLKAFVINKFRGDVEILKPGIKEVEDLTSMKCFGVVPYFEDLLISQEDGALLPYFKNFNPTKGDSVKVVILRLKYISNFWDFDPLLIEEDVELVYSLRKEDILSADLIVIPGSKKTVEDLKLLRHLGIEAVLREAVRRGKTLLGICGGFQMLGEVIRDPEGVETEEREVKGLGFLEVETTFDREKVTTQVKAKSLDGRFNHLWGYELHMGRTKGDLNLFRITRIATGEELVEGSRKGNVMGTYLHGILTNDEFRRGLINQLREKKGLSPLPLRQKYWEVVNEEVEALAKGIKAHIEFDSLLKLIGV